MPITRVRWPFLVGLLGLLTSLAGLAAPYLTATAGHLVYPLDDSYIQLAIAKHLAVSGQWDLTGEGFGGAGSSYLWPLLLAGLQRAFGPHVLTAFALNVVSAIVVLWLADRILAAHLRSAGMRAAVLLAIVIGAPLPVMAFIGMEHTLQIAAALALAWAGVVLAETSPMTPAAAALGAAAAFVALGIRPDTGAVLAGVLCVLLVNRRWVQAALLSAAAAIAPLAYAVVALRHGWPGLPASIVTKHRFAEYTHLSWRAVVDASGLGMGAAIVSHAELFCLLVAALALVAALRPDGSHEERGARRWLVIFVITCLVHAEFGRLGFLFRYEAYVVVLGVVAIAVGTAHLRPVWLWRASPAQWAALAALAWLFLLPLGLRAWRASREVVQAGAEVYRGPHRLARFVGRYPQERLASVAPGPVAYATDRPIVDLSGLGTRDVFETWRHEQDTFEAGSVRQASVAVVYPWGPSPPPTGWMCAAAWVDQRVPQASQIFLVHEGSNTRTLIDALKAFEDVDPQPALVLSQGCGPAGSGSR